MRIQSFWTLLVFGLLVVTILLDVIFYLSLRIETAKFVWADTEQVATLIIVGWK